ncbi:MAG: hypothetical protein HOO96_08810 [Polyangiaceae bacterium]|nr:hypothetical protein [Polyangiaceae bacterium]
MKFAGYLKAIEKLYAKADRTLKLQKPASARSLRDLEAELEAPLPTELRAAWELGDGSADYARVFARPGYLTGYELLSVAGARKARESMRRRAPRYAAAKYEEQKPRDPRIQPGWFAPRWLPFGELGGGSLLLLVDLSPAPKGKVGQVIAFTHDPDEMSYVESSFEKFLTGSSKAFAKYASDLIDEE